MGPCAAGHNVCFTLALCPQTLAPAGAACCLPGFGACLHALYLNFQYAMDEQSDIAYNR